MSANSLIQIPRSTVSLGFPSNRQTRRRRRGISKRNQSAKFAPSPPVESRDMTRGRLSDLPELPRVLVRRGGARIVHRKRNLAKEWKDGMDYCGFDVYSIA